MSGPASLHAIHWGNMPGILELIIPKPNIIIVQEEPKKYWRTFPLINECRKISNYPQRECDYTADVKIAYSLQLNIIKLQAKYYIISFHKSRENIDDVFSCTMSVVKLSASRKWLHGRCKHSCLITRCNLKLTSCRRRNSKSWFPCIEDKKTLTKVYFLSDGRTESCGYQTCFRLRRRR